VKKTLSVLFLFVIVSSVMFTGCGYTTKNMLGDDITSIHVANVKNGIITTREISDRRNSYSYRPGIENEVTTQVINQFIFDRSLEVEPADRAVLLLKGTLVDFRQSPLSYSDDYDVEEFRMEVYVDFELYDNRTGKLMWKENHFMGECEYAVVGPNAKSDDAAQKEAIKDIARRIVERVVETW